MFIRIFRRK